MDIDLAKKLVSTFDLYSFNKFIRDLWNCKEESSSKLTITTEQRPEINKWAFEQTFISYSNSGSKESQGYNLILPFNYPVELLKEDTDFPFELFQKELYQNLKQYSKILKKRQKDWYWPNDGNWTIPKIALATNLLDKSHNLYYKRIFPWFIDLIQKSNLSAEPMIGSYDSFFELNLDNTYQILKNFFNNRKGELVISIVDKKIEVNEFTSEKYFDKGVLHDTKSAIESAFIIQKKSNLVYEFEHLLNNYTSEKQLQNFIQHNFFEMFGGIYDRIETEVWLNFPELDINNKSRRLDLFLRNSISRDWEIFEIKRAKKIATTYRKVPTFINEIHKGIDQLRNYQNILTQDRVRKKLHADGIEYFNPELKLIIGRTPQIDLRQWRQLQSSIDNKFKLITFDDILREMEIRANYQQAIKTF
ncbi:MAG: DUF4263 domain-containing protein [Sphingobacteriales bacterium]|nr:MAG: DUF4263 domain-containing protein [Sphingobacteriales bacterium]